MESRRLMYRVLIKTKDNANAYLQVKLNTMENELNYLREKIDSCQYAINVYSSLRHPESYEQHKMKSLTKEVKLLKSILNNLTIKVLN